MMKHIFTCLAATLDPLEIVSENNPQIRISFVVMVILFVLVLIIKTIKEKRM